MRTFSSTIGAVLLSFILAPSQVPADDGIAQPRYSLDSLERHPYRFYPSFGHASQNPGSPKWFVPGYGYQIPGFGFSAGRLDTGVSSLYKTHPFGNANSSFPSATSTDPWNGNTIPWLLPGSFVRPATERFNW